MFGIGMGELLLILLAVLIIFGAGKLPEVMDSLGKAIRRFKRAMEEDYEPPQKPEEPTSKGNEPKPKETPQNHN